MKKKKLIQEIIGSKLEEHGFIYINDSGLHIYQREKNKIKQEIIICQHRFFKDEVKLIFKTSAFGQKPREIYDFMSEIKHEFWMYKDETEYKEILTYFRDVILSDGLDLLEKISVPTTDARSTPETQRYLYEHHVDLAKEYRNKLSLLAATDANIIKTIREYLISTKDKNFKEIEMDLVGLAAVYGEIFMKGDKWEWQWDEKAQICWISVVKGKPKGECPLSTIINAWRKKNYDYFECYYKEVLSNII